jgi:cell division protein FtsX
MVCAQSGIESAQNISAIKRLEDFRNILDFTLILNYLKTNNLPRVLPELVVTTK